MKACPLIFSVFNATTSNMEPNWLKIAYNAFFSSRNYINSIIIKEKRPKSDTLSHIAPYPKIVKVHSRVLHIDKISSNWVEKNY